MGNAAAPSVPPSAGVHEKTAAFCDRHLSISRDLHIGNLAGFPGRIDLFVPCGQLGPRENGPLEKVWHFLAKSSTFKNPLHLLSPSIMQSDFSAHLFKD